MNLNLSQTKTSLDQRSKCAASVVLCLGFVLASAAVAQVHEYTLENGLKLLIKEDHRAPVVVSQIWYKVGSSHEYDGVTGISHALEHMMFKGTENHPGGEFSSIIARQGGRENAFTGRDYTAYYQSLESARLEVSFSLEADRMRNLLLPEEAFEKEIKVVKEERRMRVEDNPVAYLYESALATAYQVASYRRPIIGWMADLETLRVSDLRAWYDRWYAPNNAVLVVVGDVEHAAVHRLAQQYFGPLEAATMPPLKMLPEPPQQGTKRITVKRPAELPHLMLAWKVPALQAGARGEAQTKAPYILETLAGVLDGGYSARLETQLVRTQEVAGSVSISYNLTGRSPGLFIIQATPRQTSTVAELERALKEQVAQLKETPVSAEELSKVQAQLMSGDIYERDSLFYQAMRLGVYETAGLPRTLADEYTQRIQAVTAQQIQQAAAQFLTADRLTVAVLEPQPVARSPAAPQQATADASAVTQ